MITISRKFMRGNSVCFFAVPKDCTTLTRVTFYGNEPTAETINLPPKAGVVLSRASDLLDAAVNLFEQLAPARKVYEGKTLRTER